MGCFLSGFLWIEKFKKEHLFEIEIFIIKVSVTFDQLIASLLNKSMNYSQKKKHLCFHTCFSTCSAGHPCTCLMKFSLKCAASVGVKEHVALPEAVPAGTEPGGIAPLTTPGPWPPPLLLLLLLPMWFGPGDGLLWLLQITNSGWVNVYLI